ncbi:MAG: PD40 domain-containing protein [Desulfamplus sp.]|nr:PD40 domain-containing protein [Desulfamplus sp.]
MSDYEEWNWDIGKKQVADLSGWQEQFPYIEELRVSSDGERVAAIVKNEDMEFTVCIQSEGEELETWETGYDKAWNLQFGPDDRLSALVSDTSEWKVCTDGETWENGYDFLWNMTFNTNGVIAVSAQKELLYSVLNNDVPWENEFSRLTGMVISPDGQKTAAVVESVPVLESEIFKFRTGCYSVAVNGETWERNFMNVWNPVFSGDSNHVAASVRTSYYDYYIAVDGKIWDTAFSSVWEPRFAPLTITKAETKVSSDANNFTNAHNYSVTAPVKKGGKWFLAKDGEIFWDRPYFQLWHHLYSPDSSMIAAIVSPEFGRWTIASDNTPWELTFSDYVSDPIFSPDGKRIACLFKENGKWGVAVDGKAWDFLFDMVWQPIFSNNGLQLAVKIKKDGNYYIAINGSILDGKYEDMANPLFSPDNSSMLIRGRQGDSYNREVISLKGRI